MSTMDPPAGPALEIGCPDCNEPLEASVPTDDRGDDAWDESFRLRGTETACGNCGHQLGLYFF